jgi:hypothetical protein
MTEFFGNAFLPLVSQSSHDSLILMSYLGITFVGLLLFNPLSVFVLLSAWAFPLSAALCRAARARHPAPFKF